MKSQNSIVACSAFVRKMKPISQHILETGSDDTNEGMNFYVSSANVTNVVPTHVLTMFRIVTSVLILFNIQILLPMLKHNI
jgi:hypothetical protein